jgi:hypothetical protein
MTCVLRLISRKSVSLYDKVLKVKPFVLFKVHRTVI